MRRVFFGLALIFGLISAQGLVAQPAGAVTAPSIGSTNTQTNNLVHHVHGRHCRKRYGPVRHWHGRYGHVHSKWHRHCRRYYRRYYRPHYYRPYRRPGIYLRIGSRTHAGARAYS